MCTVLLPPGGYPIAVNKYIIPYHIIHWHFRTNCCLHRHVKSVLIVGPVNSFQTLVPNNQNIWRHNGTDRHFHCVFSRKFLAASLAAYYVRLHVQKYRFAAFMCDKLRKHKYINERNSAFSVFDRSRSTFKLRKTTWISEWQYLLRLKVILQIT
jgi:hypothetical protein